MKAKVESYTGQLNFVYNKIPNMLNFYTMISNAISS